MAVVPVLARTLARPPARSRHRADDDVLDCSTRGASLRIRCMGAANTSIKMELSTRVAGLVVGML